MNRQLDLNLTNVSKEVKDHIKQLERVRSDFVANVSHELRTPLTVIRGYLENLMQQEQVDISQLHKIFQQMHQHSLRMENIVNDLLLLSRLEREVQSLEEKEHVHIMQMLKNLCDDAEKISGDKNHHFTLTGDFNLHLLGSEEELRSLFSNLIINAVRYTPVEGSINIRWYNEKGKAIFSVSDTGIGIAKEHIPRITERFYRVDKARSRDSGGTGLGLAIVKHVLMRHQAELRIESQLNYGSTFTCVFPANRTVVIKLSQ